MSRADRGSRRTVLSVAVALALPALVVVATTAVPAVAATGPVRVVSTSVGKVLATPKGRTVYVFAADSKGKSTCTGSCAVSWPPVIVSSKDVGSLASSSARFGTITRANGKLQLTVNGWPVYTFAGDDAKGDVAGQRVSAYGGTWWVVGPNGKRITAQRGAPAASPTTDPGGGTLNPGDFY